MLAAETGHAALNVFKTAQDVVIYPCSGTGAWEAALVNVLAKGDRVLMYETGHFAAMWKKMAEKLGLRPEFIILVRWIFFSRTRLPSRR